MINHSPKISVYKAMSIDGFIARSDGSLDWLEQVHKHQEDYGYEQFFSTVDALIIGRKTYGYPAEIEVWPYNGKRVIVLSSTLQSVKPEAELYRGDLVQLVSKLSSEGIRHILVEGGETVSHFLRAKLIDEMILSIIPVLLGSGIPLFRIHQELPCHLVSSQSYPSGLVQVRYQLEKI